MIGGWRDGAHTVIHNTAEKKNYIVCVCVSWLNSGATKRSL